EAFEPPLRLRDRAVRRHGHSITCRSPESGDRPRHRDETRPRSALFHPCHRPHAMVLLSRTTRSVYAETASVGSLRWPLRLGPFSSGPTRERGDRGKEDEMSTTKRKAGAKKEAAPAKKSKDKEPVKRASAKAAAAPAKAAAAPAKRATTKPPAAGG